MKRASNTPTQEQRVARALRFAGSRGITQIDFDAPALDGSAPIRRVASRINELRSKGWVIDSRGRRLSMARYVLVSEPDGNTRPQGDQGLKSDEHNPPSLVEVKHRPANAVLGWDGE